MLFTCLLNDDLMPSAMSHSQWFYQHQWHHHGKVFPSLSSLNKQNKILLIPSTQKARTSPVRPVT